MIEKKNCTELMTTDSINELSSTPLKKELRNIMAAVSGVKKNTWKYADAVSNIMTGELFTDDFKNASEFATYIGTSAATVSMYCAAVKFVDGITAYYGENGYTADIIKDAITVSKAYILSTIERIEEFSEWLLTNTEYDINDVRGMSDKMLKEIVKEYNAIMGAGEQKEADSVDTEEDGDEAENNEAPYIGIAEKIENYMSGEMGGKIPADFAALVKELLKEYTDIMNDTEKE